MYGLKLIAILAVMGGAIAYIGDRLGTKVGKRKLTIFNLRPKYTSILVTIITGVMIAAVTLGVLALTSRDVRTALFGMEALKTQMAALTREVSTQNAELETSRAALEAKTAEYSVLTIKIKDTAARLTAITRELDSVVAERDRTAAALSQVQSDYALARTGLDKAEREIHTLQATKEELDTKVKNLSEAKATLQSDVDHLNEIVENLKQNIQNVRQGTVIFRAGEVLSTTTLHGGENKAEIEKSLTAIIYKTNQAIVERLDVADKNLEVLWISKVDFEQAVNLLASTPQDVIIRISAAGNIIYGEPVIGQIELFPNQLVYKQGTLIYSEVVEVGKDPQQAEEAVMSFLQKINVIAVKQGILPDPIQGTVGTIGGAQLFDTVNKVKRCDGKVELSVVTKTDIYTVGPLRIDIRVRQISP